MFARATLAAAYVFAVVAATTAPSALASGKAGPPSSVRAHNSGTAVVYDRAGVHPQCSEGPADFMAQCVLPSDPFAYYLSADPVLNATTTCDELGGFDYVAMDPVFGFKLFWRGGIAGISNFSHQFHPGHLRTAEYLEAYVAPAPSVNIGFHRLIMMRVCVLSHFYDCVMCDVCMAPAPSPNGSVSVLNLAQHSAHSLKQHEYFGCSATFNHACDTCNPYGVVVLSILLCSCQHTCSNVHTCSRVY